MTIDEAVQKYHWIKQDGDTIELFLDHHMMSSFRMCEAYGSLLHLEQLGARGKKPWPLQFGSALHTVIEYIYQKKHTEVLNFTELKDYTVEVWKKYDLDSFADHKGHQNLGGLVGFVTLVVQYATYYSGEQERLRPIATELPFGKDREVPIGWSEWAGRFVKIFLTGRIDFLMDSGTVIGPTDHKTMAFFKGNPLDTYDPQDGMTGYIYATRYILKKHFPELVAARKVDRMWMNFIQVKMEEDPAKRFRRMLLFKSEYQLEQYRERQISTAITILDLICGREPQWNTNICNNFYHQRCMFKNLHTQTSEAAFNIIKNHDFEVKPQWDWENIED